MVDEEPEAFWVRQGVGVIAGGFALIPDRSEALYQAFASSRFSTDSPNCHNFEEGQRDLGLIARPIRVVDLTEFTPPFHVE
jgi:hypothetical protein